MNVAELFPSKYLRAEDLNGRDVSVTIRAVTEEEMGFGKDKETHPVLWFHGAKKGMVLKRTNGLDIAKMHGKETDDWAGKRITLYPDRVHAFGEWQDVVRVRPTAPPAPAQKTVAQESAPKISEEYRQYLGRVVDLSGKHDNLFYEGSDVSGLRANMMNHDAFDADPMPTVPVPGKATSMYGYLKTLIDRDVDVSGSAEPILSYLLKRIVTDVTPPTVGHKFLIDDLNRAESDFREAIVATWGVIQDNVRRP